MRRVLGCVYIFLWASTFASAQEKPQAYVGARILPVNAPAIEDGVLVVEGGKIVAVGPRSTVKTPPDAETFDVSGKVLMPGIVDTHSHIGEEVVEMVRHRFSRMYVFSIRSIHGTRGSNVRWLEESPPSM
jgi:imidazolonepropionase-like amidohydrolase